MEIPGLSNNTTENLKQKKIISWAPVDQATDESSGPNQLKWIALGRGHPKSELNPKLHPLAILYGQTARFVSDLVGNPEYTFPHDAAHMKLIEQTWWTENLPIVGGGA